MGPPYDMSANAVGAIIISVRLQVPEICALTVITNNYTITHPPPREQHTLRGTRECPAAADLSRKSEGTRLGVRFDDDFR